MPLTAAAKNTGLDAIAAVITHISLRNVATEVTGGSYARQAVAWGAAASGVVAMTGTEVFSCPAGAVVNRIGLETALSGGTDQGYAAVTEETFGSAGTLTVNTLTITLSDA